MNKYKEPDTAETIQVRIDKVVAEAWEKKEHQRLKERQYNEKHHDHGKVVK